MPVTVNISGAANRNTTFFGSIGGTNYDQWQEYDGKTGKIIDGDIDFEDNGLIGKFMFDVKLTNETISIPCEAVVCNDVQHTGEAIMDEIGQLSKLEEDVDDDCELIQQESSNDQRIDNLDGGPNGSDGGSTSASSPPGFLISSSDSMIDGYNGTDSGTSPAQSASDSGTDNWISYDTSDNGNIDYKHDGFYNEYGLNYNVCEKYN